MTHGSSDVASAADNVASAADKVEGHPVLQNGARAGYALNGSWLLTIVGLGIATYGLYSLARARHARV